MKDQPANLLTRALQGLPGLTPEGLLPAGIHESTWDKVEDLFVTNHHRRNLWDRLSEFRDWVLRTGDFAAIYLDGGYVTSKAEPNDIDVVLETRQPYGPDALHAMAPFFRHGIDAIFNDYGVHVHFWAPGFPGSMNDFRLFFQYLSPQEAAPRGLPSGATKGIVKIPL